MDVVLQPVSHRARGLPLAHLIPDSGMCAMHVVLHQSVRVKHVRETVGVELGAETLALLESNQHRFAYDHAVVDTANVY